MYKCGFCGKIKQINDKTPWSGCETCDNSACCPKCLNINRCYFCKTCINSDKTTPNDKKYMSDILKIHNLTYISD